MRVLLGVVGAVLGGAVGLFGPVFAFQLLHIGSGSYEDVLPLWVVAVPGGVAVGAALGALLGRPTRAAP